MDFQLIHTQAGEEPLLLPELGLQIRVRLPLQASGGGLSIIETVNAPGFGPPLHRHRETEIFHVLRGRYLFEVDGKRFYAETGDVVTAPGGVAHAFVNVGSEPASQFIIIEPGLDALAFFSGLGDVMKGGRPDEQALAEFGKQWGVEFLGPPIHDRRA
jgi:quercetin dioxygenase-like cupin family protein